MKIFQMRVRDWCRTCFGMPLAEEPHERAMRFVEEALELGQAAGLSLVDTSQVVLYVYGRPAGEVCQEVGGVMVTLAALCNPRGIDIERAANGEIFRVEAPKVIEEVRMKNLRKREVLGT